MAMLQYFANMQHTNIGVRGIFGNGSAFKGLDNEHIKGKVVLVVGATQGVLCIIV